MAEVNIHTKRPFQFLVFLEQQIIVSRDGTHLGEPLLDAEECPMDVFNGYRQHFLHEGRAQFAIRSRQQDSRPVFPRYDEVRLNVTDPPPPIDDCRPLVNEYAVFELAYLETFPSPFSLSHQILPVCLNPAAIDAFQESLNGVRRDAGEISLMLLDAPRNTLRGSALHQLLFNERPQFGIRHDLHALIL